MRYRHWAYRGLQKLRTLAGYTSMVTLPGFKFLVGFLSVIPLDLCVPPSFSSIRETALHLWVNGGLHARIDLPISINHGPVQPGSVLIGRWNDSVGLPQQRRRVLHNALGFLVPFNAHLWVRNIDRIKLRLPEGDRGRPKEGAAFRLLPCWEDSWVHYESAHSQFLRSVQANDRSEGRPTRINHLGV